MTKAPFTHALITGASSGIGEALAHKLGKAGVGMVLVARRKERLDAIAAQYANCEVLAADLTTDAGVSAVLTRLRDSTRTPIDLVVNNAGFGTSGNFADADPERLSNEVSLNINALMRIAHEAIRQMQPRGRGYLLNVSSIASFQAGPGLAVYSATKAFVTSLTEALYEELRGSGIRVRGSSESPYFRANRDAATPPSGPLSHASIAVIWVARPHVESAGLAINAPRIGVIYDVTNGPGRR
ncbi:MAG: SDR family NAD(P)-dependent oxidoreductase [Actinobacteria bacterium]|nr:SDR family NAD(P)-dependent oxidoreductase [Actinomycetota bacterium]